MAQAIRAIPVEHDPASHLIETCFSTPGESIDPPLQLTLLELVQAVNEIATSEQELIATVLYMLRSGRIQLSGNFRDCSLDAFDD